MDKESDITFQDTLDWANTKSEGKTTSSKGIPIFYLIMGAVIILILVILIVYLIGRNPEEEDALEMMKDDKYLYGDIYDDEGSYSSDGNYYNDDGYDERYNDERYNDEEYDEEGYIDPNDQYSDDGEYVDPLPNIN